MKRSFKDLASGRNFANNSSIIRLIVVINTGHYSSAIDSLVITKNSLKLTSSYFRPIYGYSTLITFHKGVLFNVEKKNAMLQCEVYTKSW